jgi:two-component system OmpR family sensor kinase
VLQRLSLRARLILGVIALAGIGLVAADVVTYTSLHSFLISRTDDFLDTAHSSAESALQGPGRGGSHGGEPPSSTARGPDIGRLEARVPGLFVQVRRPNGTIVATGAAPQFPGTKQAAPPRLPVTIVPTTRHGDDRVTYFTVGATKGGERYRVRASIDPNSNGYTLIVATSLSSVDSTLHRLVLVELLVTLAVLGAVAMLGLWVIRVGLRPLTEIGATAATIAAGDLSHRVAREDDRTEVGRLGRALNAMLAQIESAFNAREASERKLRRFVADASHELRTPLAAVRAYAELFSRGAAQRPADLERTMAGITRESERMSVLVDDLLLLARLDEGRPLERERVELHDVVAESVETARMLEPDRVIACRLDQATVVGDRDRLRQVVDNLFSNVRAHAGAAASVDVLLERADGAARLTVTDSGPGLAPDQAEHVFERFYRADPSRARAAGGAGLGLSIVAAVTEAQGGRATASAAPHGGAAFTIELPLATRP